MTTEPFAPAVVPTLTFEDAPGAIDYLQRTFGLTVHEQHLAEDGSVMHAELRWGNGIVMVSTRQEGSPFSLGPQCVYLVTDDPDGLYERAVAAGAEIVMAPTDQDYGSRDFSTRDIEGNVWAFGTFQPGAAST
jgi:uncharacterized glyoxalase superfamily protein PhnB